MCCESVAYCEVTFPMTLSTAAAMVGVCGSASHVHDTKSFFTRFNANSQPESRPGLAVCLSIARSSHFLRFLTQHLTQTPSCGPTGPIGQNVPLLSPSTPFRLTLTKFSDFQYMTGMTAGASNRSCENIEKLAIATLKSPHRVTVRPNFFLRTSV
jgi:hypothetical protein